VRIRSIKPDFWRSQDISSLEWHERFLFIGLWSYVDDNGVGLDRLSLIATDLFPDDVERDPSEIFARVSRGLERLETAGRIARYTIDGRQFLAIVNWAKHQKIDRPNKPRYPLPTSKNAMTREGLASVSRGLRESPSPGTGEQGNRGTGEQEEKAPPPAVAAEHLFAEPEPEEDREPEPKAVVAVKPKSPEQLATEAAYERVGKAFKFVAVLQIAKWAIHDRGIDPVTVENAIVSVYEMGKPITRQTIGQYLDGHINRDGRSTKAATGGLTPRELNIAQAERFKSNPNMELLRAAGLEPANSMRALPGGQ
jgi:hypothetical protein